jgi:site-specific DNA-methyltransferase (adenine-specific)
MKELRLLNGDCLDKLKELENNSIDSIVTDPPYGLSFMGKKWDYDVPSVEIWQECLRVLKPGGHLLAFAGSRTYHRMAVRIEDAGFDIRDQIMWIYGSGFPKSHNVGKSIDKMQGNQRKVVGTKADFALDGAKRNATKHREVGEAAKEIGHEYGYKSGWDTPVDKGNSIGEGWGTALKPAHEPIVMARKPIEGTVAENTLQYGVGGLNIDGTRIQMQDGDKMDIRRYNAYHDTFNSYEDGESAKGKEYVVAEPHEGGRWPANVIINEEGDEEWKRYFYCPKANKKDRDEGNIHPTVKPTDLMKYLIRLVTPKDGIVLDPFMGSGSTGKAAMQEGMWFVGIEREKEYYEIAKQRIEHEMDKRKFW